MVQTVEQVTDLLSEKSVTDVVRKVNMRIQPVQRPQGKEVPKRLGVSKLKQNNKRQIDESWTVFRGTVYSLAMNSLGPVSRKHQDWFDENNKEIHGLLEEKHQKHKSNLSHTKLSI